MKEQINRKLAAMGCLTIALALLLMYVGRLEGVLPDWAIRVVGIATMICTAVSVFFSVRELAKASRKESQDE